METETQVTGLIMSALVAVVFCIGSCTAKVEESKNNTVRTLVDKGVSPAAAACSVGRGDPVSCAVATKAAQ